MHAIAKNVTSSKDEARMMEAPEAEESTPRSAAATSLPTSDVVGNLASLRPATLGGRGEVQLFQDSDRERFYAKTRRAANGCLLWTAGKTRSGHGKFVLHGKTMIAHRVAWLFEHGEVLSPEQLLLHSCSTAACVEVSHLKIGTHAENMADRAAAGHYNTSRGLNNPFARFTDAEVADMREMIAAGISYSSVADAFRCSRTYVALIARGKLRNLPTSESSDAVLAEGERLARANARRTRATEIIGFVHPDDEIDGEEWRATPYEGYLVSSLGRVRGRNMTILKPYIRPSGHAVVFCGKGNPRGVHTLVCEAWNGPPPAAGMHAAHYNGKPLDNAP